MHGTHWNQHAQAALVASQGGIMKGLRRGTPHGSRVHSNTWPGGCRCHENKGLLHCIKELPPTKAEDRIWHSARYCFLFCADVWFVSWSCKWPQGRFCSCFVIVFFLLLFFPTLIRSSLIESCANLRGTKGPPIPSTMPADIGSYSCNPLLGAVRWVWIVI